MHKKKIKIYFLKIKKVKKTKEKEIDEALTEDDIKELFDTVGKIPLDINTTPSRYYGKGDDSYCLLLPKDRTVQRPKIKRISGMITGAFLRRRSSNYPFEDNGQGMLEELIMKDENNEIAEVTLFIIDPSNQTLIWLGNRNVAGWTKFGIYLKRKYYEILQKKRKSKNSTDDSKFGLLTIGDNLFGDLAFSHYLNNDALSSFNNDMKTVKKLEVRIDGDMTELERYATEGKNMEEALNAAIDMAKNSESTTIKLTLANRSEQGLSKVFAQKFFNGISKVAGIHDATKQYTVTGDIDDHSRTLDLISDKLVYQEEIESESKYLEYSKIYDIMLEAYRNYDDKINN